MSLNDNRQNKNNNWLNIEISIKNNHPNLLQGLDRWLQLNLITESQVKKICRQHLSCNLPIVESQKTISAIKRNKSSVVIPTKVKERVKPNIIRQLWQSFLDELSIRWLLFLGIFLVVVSSGVLAASQWDNFPKFGQYLILLVYTLGFWGIGFWSKKQDNLKLTSQTLNAIAILLIPINFWAINKFALGNNLGEWLTIGFALIILTTTIYLQPFFSKYGKNNYFIFLFLLLSYVHLGWQLYLVPKIAIYGGMAAITLFHYRLLLPKQQYPKFKLLFLLAAWLLLLIRSLFIDLVFYNLAIALFGWLLATVYLTRDRQTRATQSVFRRYACGYAERYPLGILEGRGVARQNRKHSLKEARQSITNSFFQKIFQVFSLIILTCSWLISLLAGISNSQLFFWQTVVISILAIHLLSQRLTLYWYKKDLTAVFLIGLQTLYISKELIPDSFRSEALNLAVTVSKSEYLPESVLGVTLFPYIILFVFIATWLYRRQKLKLALHAEILTLFFGFGLTSLSYFNPVWRALNLLLSTVTFGYVVIIRKPIRIPLINTTHLLGLFTIASSIWAIFPNLSLTAWGSIFILLTLGEWSIYLNRIKRSRIKLNTSFVGYLVRSCWYFGWLLSVISYSCFLSSIATTSNTSFWGLLWLITPGILTLIAKDTRNLKQRRLITGLSCTTLIVAQLLVTDRPIARVIALTIAIGLMFINSFSLRRTLITVIHLGFGLSLIVSLLYSYVTGWNWLIIGAITILCLYWLRQYIQRTLNTPQLAYISQRVGYGILGVGTEPHNKKLILKYSKAIDYWASAIMILEVTLLSSIYLNTNWFNSYPQYLLSITLILIAVIWRYQKQPNNFVSYGITWSTELLAIGIVRLAGGNDFTIAITNIILGLFAFILIQKRALSISPWTKLNLAYIPLIYTGLAIVWRLNSYSTYTGLITLGAAFILINSKQNNRQLNIVTNYLGFAGISLGIYEIVIYQMQQTSGGSTADGITILALIGAAIAFCYRLSAWWYRQRNRTTMFALDIPQVILVAHIHWAISSILKIIAATIAIESITPRLTPISIATSFCLGAYAIIQGKDNELLRSRERGLKNEENYHSDRSQSSSDWWVYVGLVEIVATLVYSRLIINKLSLLDPLRVVITCLIALIIYQIPWQNLGWRSTPWQRTAVIIPALMTMVTAEDISYFSLIAIAAFYLRIAYYQKNIRWTYLSLGFINWGIIRLIWQYNTEFIWLATTICLSILYIAQFDPELKSHRQQRHNVRLIGSSIICVVALFYQDTGLIPSLISLAFIFLGLGFKIRAFLFTGTITLVLTVIYQLVILVLTYSFLKWIVGFFAGVCLIFVAASFEKQKGYLNSKLQNYTGRLQNWE